MSGADFGEAVQNGEHSDAVEADETTAEMLMRDEEELVEERANTPDDGSEKGQEEILQIKRGELETVVEEIVDRKLEERESGVESEEPKIPIEREARQHEDLRDLSKNQERAVKIWQKLPEYSDGRHDKLLLNYNALKEAIEDVEGVEKVNSNTVNRVRKKLEEMSAGIARVEKLKGKHARKRLGVAVTVQAWGRHRPEEVVVEHLPKKVAQKIVEGN